MGHHLHSWSASELAITLIKPQALEAEDCKTLNDK